MPTMDEKRNHKTALEMYGPWVGKPMHDTPVVPSFICHTLLVKVFRFTDEEAGKLIDELIRKARSVPEDMPCFREFTTHQGTRTWQVSARQASPATLFKITSQEASS